MQDDARATELWRHFFRWSMPQIRAFHFAWFAFFLCFFAWFGIAPLMPVVREELGLTREQIGWSIVASVAMTVLARLAIGPICDHFGPRRTYSGLLIFASLPVMAIGLARDPATFIALRLAIGVIGASFVITQYHTSLMFAPNIVGTAMATSAGWGNLGGGATQLGMPLLLAALVTLGGLTPAAGWRAAMFLVGIVCLLAGLAYYRFTQDTPEGNFPEVHVRSRLSEPAGEKDTGASLTVWTDGRVWALFAAYGACFGVELTLNNIVALYFVDHFDFFESLDAVQALSFSGLFASIFGATNLFARTLGGALGDRFGNQWGLPGRVWWLFMVLLCEGIALMLFSQVTLFGAAVGALLVLGILVQAAEGATFAIVPFLHRRALGTVSGIVGAGGNLAAIGAAFLFRGSLPWRVALLTLGLAVIPAALGTLVLTFTAEVEEERGVRCEV